MTSGYIPASGEPGPDEILTALKEAIHQDPGLQERPPEEVSRDLAHGGYLQGDPSPTLVAEMLGALEGGNDNRPASRTEDLPP
jgi:hypothetical protein